MQIGTVLAWDFCAVCTRGGYCADRDRISLGLFALHKGGYCAHRDRIELGTFARFAQGGGTVQIGTVLAWDFCAVCTRGGGGGGTVQR